MSGISDPQKAVGDINSAVEAAVADITALASQVAQLGTADATAGQLAAQLEATATTLQNAVAASQPPVV